MSPSSLQGLDIIRPAQDSSATDSRDLLLDQADLSAQLDLWTSLNFESDDPLPPEDNNHKNSFLLPPEEEDDGHTKVVTPTNINSPPDQVQNQNIPGLINPAAAVAAAAATAAAATQSFDLNTFLAGFGVDSFAPPQPHLQQAQPHPQVIAPSLAQLLALHSAHNVGYPSQGFLPYQIPLVNPSSAAPAATPLPRNSSIENSTSEESYGSAKRTRTRRSSMTVNSPEDGSPSSGTGPATPNTVASGSLSPPPVLTSPSAAEDKRRRNTAASARFRLKKKEREAALETKAKELETKVVELERECEALRRENGWLKGLVVGVTGAAAQAPSGQGNVTAPGPPPVSAGTKRSREEGGVV